MTFSASPKYGYNRIPFPSESDEARVTFLTANLPKPLLGLQPEMYANLLEKATLDIHNAWPVNFNMSLASFRPSIEGLVKLIKLTASSASAKLFFISSISSVVSYKTTSRRTPESVIDPHASRDAPAANGYAASKYISELILSYASKKFPAKTSKFSFARVGQIAGPVKRKGIWNKTEWFPSLIISSLHIGAIPNSLGSTLGRIDWVPVDLLADIIVELALSKNNRNRENDASVEVFHPSNPKPSSWEKIRPELVADILSITGKVIDVIPLHVWVAKVKNDMESKVGVGNTLKEGELEGILEDNPAVKLLDFYGHVLGSEAVSNVLETEKTERASEKLRTLDGVNREWIVKWLSEWVEARL